MLRSLRLAVPAFLLLAACSGSPSSFSGDAHPTSDGTATPAPDPTTTPPPVSNGGDVERVIAEADIVQVGGTSLYAISKTGTLSIIDLSKPNQLSLLGEVLLSGSPFEMYLQPNGRIVVMLTSDTLERHERQHGHGARREDAGRDPDRRPRARGRHDLRLAPRRQHSLRRVERE